MPQSYTDDLLTYFTDVENLRDLFKAYLAAPELPKRILVIHGVGGIGKSSLLRMFRLHCKSIKTPVALASGDEAKSAPAILGDWADDLKADGVTLPTFAKTRQHYRELQARAEDKAQESRKKMGDLAGKTAGKIAETAAGAAVGAAIGSFVPGIGTIAGALGGMGAEALVDWLRGQGFAKQDIDLLLDPAKKLTDDFLADIERVAPKRRLVLMLDTFEQLSALEDWARDLAKRMHSNVLLVLAGRAVPNWGRAWSGWLAQTHVEELKPMTDDVMRELVRRYYAIVRGGEPDPKQVDAIIGFARGLPMVVTTAVQLWVEYGVEDFEAIKAEVVADLVDRLKEGVPEKMTPMLEAAATVRWFNKDVLRAVTDRADVNTAYDELRRFPFVRSRAEGLALHDAVREIMDEGLRMHDPERYCEMHERAAGYFAAQMAKRGSEEAERLDLERLYHRICADEEAGIKLFQEIAEESTRYRLVNRLRALLSDANTYPLKRENSRLWRQYYSARMMYLEARFVTSAEIYEAISESEYTEPKLRAYALSDWGQMLEYLSLHDRSIPILQTSLSIVPIDSHLAIGLLELCHAYMRIGELEKSEIYLLRARDFFAESSDKYGLIYTLNSMKYHYLNQGFTVKAILCLRQSKEALGTLTQSPRFLHRDIIGGSAVYWAWLLGRLKDTERDLREALNANQELALVESGTSRDLGYILGMEGKYEDAEKCFSISETISKKIEIIEQEEELSVTIGFRGAILKKQGLFDEAEEKLKHSLASKQRLKQSNGIPELCVWLGELFETKAGRDSTQESASCRATAQSCYYQALDFRWTGRRNFICAALSGLVRVKHAQGDYAAIPRVLGEAEQLAQQYEYNDHLASLRLTQGHVAWDSSLPEWGSGFDVALHYYQHALIYALRYNRFLLDEALSGRPQGTPLRPIVPHCLEHGEEGRRMLIALRDWWQTGVNDIGTPRPDTISPIPEGIPLLEAERIARKREPGDDSPQRTVLEQIDEALSEPNSVQLTTEDQQ